MVRAGGVEVVVLGIVVGGEGGGCWGVEVGEVLEVVVLGIVVEGEEGGVGGVAVLGVGEVLEVV